MALEFDNLQLIRMETGEMKLQVQFKAGSEDNRKTFGYTPETEEAAKFVEGISENLAALIKQGSDKLVSDFNEHIADLKDEVEAPVSVITKVVAVVDGETKEAATN